MLRDILSETKPRTEPASHMTLAIVLLVITLFVILLAKQIG